MTSILRYPPSIDWEVTPSCNHLCKHCYNFWRNDSEQQNEEKFLSSVNEEYYSLIAQKIIDAKPVYVLITGGEPLTIFDKIKETIPQFVESGISVSMNTNLTLINDEIASFLAKYNVSLFCSLPCCDPQICDSITQSKDSLRRITQGNEVAKKYGLSIGWNMVVSKENYDYIYDTAKYCKYTLGGDYFSATKVSLPVHSCQEMISQALSRTQFQGMLNTLLKIRDELSMNIDSAWSYSLCGFMGEDIINQFAFKRNCGAGKFTFSVSFNGDIKACSVDSKPYGNILHDNFSDVMAKMVEWQTGTYIPDECKTCKSLALCGGGCRLDAKNTYGDIRALDSTANLNNKEYNYSSPLAGIEFEDDMKLSLETNVIFLEENNCVRVNNNSRYMFITLPFFDYLKLHKVFSIRDLSKDFSLDDTSVRLFVASLINNRILKIVCEE